MSAINARVESMGSTVAPNRANPRTERAANQKKEAERSAAASLDSSGGRIEIGARSARFSYDESAGRVVVTILAEGAEPREVVRQIPAEEYLAFVARFREMLGVLFDDMA
jgi:uncharacterized FlaG/YvyC family protein